MSGRRKVFIDANVFVTSWVFDVYLTLADAGLVEPHWSGKVVEEGRRAIAKVGGPRRQGSHIDAAEAAYPFASVRVGDSDHASINLPDPDDRHVVAAAQAGGCEVIVTCNIKDFPASELVSRGLRAVHSDDYLMELANTSPEVVLAAVLSLVAAKKHPPRSLAQELAGLRADMLFKFADFVEARSS